MNVRKLNHNNRGITLIALVITIVILLILAGITVNLVFSDNGIIKKAQEVANTYEDAAIEEMMEIYKLEKSLGDTQTIKDKLIQDGLTDADTLEQNGIVNLTDNIILVTNFEGLKVISNNVNNNDIDYAGKKIYVINDIDCEAQFNEKTGELIQGENFNPIGDSNVQIENEETEEAIIKEFNGTFDGLDYKIKNLYIQKNSVGDFCIALFGYVGENGIVENVIIANSYIQGYYETGAIVGRNKGIIRNCTNESKVVGDYYLTGGIAGRNCNTIENCINKGEIKGANTQTGGIVANCDFGSQVIVKDCKNFGDISATGNCIGGIVGGAFTTNEGNNVSILNCYNTSKIENQQQTGNSIGGIVGYANKGNGNYLEIQNCNNEGEINGYQQIGGIIGRNYFGNINSCMNSGKVQAIYQMVGGIIGVGRDCTISKSCNEGYIYLSEQGFYGAGGIAGRLESNETEGAKIEECHNTGEVYSLADKDRGRQTAGIVGNVSTAEEMPLVEINNCYNTGYIHGIGGMGGIVNFGNGVIINNCYNIGTLESKNSVISAGVITTESTNSGNQYSNNYWLDTCGATYGINNTSSNEGTEPKTEEQMKNLDTILGDAYSRDLYNQNNGYPILKWQLGE